MTTNENSYPIQPIGTMSPADINLLRLSLFDAVFAMNNAALECEKNGMRETALLLRDDATRLLRELLADGGRRES